MSVSTHSVPDDGARAAGKVVGSGADGGNRGPNFTNAVGACASSAPLRKAGSPGDDTPLMPDICSEPGNVPTRILYHYLYADRQGFGLCINDWNVTNGQDARVGGWTVRNVCGEAADAAGAVNVLVHALLRHSVMTRTAMAEIGTHVLRDL